MTPKQKALSIAKRLGVEIDQGVDDERRLVELTCEAPAGFVWSSSGVHELVACRSGDECNTTADELWRDVAERMSHGVERCSVESCEWCDDPTGHNTDENE